MTKEKLEREYYAYRPTETYSEDDSPNDWVNIVHYAEENLDKAFKTIAELKKENAELKEQCLILADCNTCKTENIEMKKQLTKAQEIIKNLIDDLIAIDGEQIGELEAVKEAEQFLKESE